MEHEKPEIELLKRRTTRDGLKLAEIAIWGIDFAAQRVIDDIEDDEWHPEVPD